MTKLIESECEREELHLSGAIQPHGALLVVDADGVVVALSDNHASLLGDDAACVIGQPLPEILARLLPGLPQETGSRLDFDAVVDGRHAPLDAALSRNAVGQTVIELLPAIDTDSCSLRELAIDVEPAGETADIMALQTAVVDRVLRITGFHRVMYYRFLDDGDGEVLAEARDPLVYGSYLGLRFPASDIPQIARLLYLLNPWRMIPDIGAQTVSLRSIDAGVPDLSYSDLRSVSPIHLVYLGNMKVQASLSFPIVVGNDLWGLVACHHAEPRHLSQHLLKAAAGEVRAHALLLAGRIAQRRMQLIDGLQRRFGGAREILYRAGDLLSAWETLGAWLCKEFRADGALLCVGEVQRAYGDCLGGEALLHVDHHFQDETVEPLWITDCLSGQLRDCPLSLVAGLLAVKAWSTGGKSIRIYLCRQEYIHEVAWGGSPDKPLQAHDGRYGIAPRRSFEKWVERRLGRSRPWDNESRLLGLKLRELLIQPVQNA